MTALGPNARALVQASRKALRATPTDRERIEAALRARLGTSALPPDSGVAPISSTASWPVVAGAAVGLCVAGAAAFLALRPATSVRVPQAQTASPSARTAPPSAAPALAPIVPAPARAPASAPRVSPHVRDRLGEEVALLSRATSQLRAGHAGAALAIIAEHQRKFPSGTLAEERRAARVQALCALGRVREGRSELLRLAPQSPAAARAEQVCDDAAGAASDRR
jgi:hypothetical protein